MITPLPFGGGVGGGATIFLTPVSLCHYVILSKKSHLSPFVIMSLCLKKTNLSSFVIMSFCLKKYICLPPSLCYSVLKTTASVTSVLMLLCLKNHPACYSCLTLLPCLPYPVSPVLMLLCLKNHPICYSCLTLLPCLPYPVSPVLGYSVFQAEARGEESGKSFPAHREL